MSLLATSSTDATKISRKLLALASTLIRSRTDALVLLSTTALVVWGVLKLSAPSNLFALWLAFELGFFLYSRWRYNVVSNGLPDDACMDRARAQVIMDRLYNMETTYTIQDFFSGWFRGADPASIGHENLKDFTAYGFFGSRLQDLSPQVQQDIEEYITKCEVKFGYTFKPGYNKNIRFMAHLWEPLRVMHKPLLLVLLGESFAVSTDIVLFLLGFKVKRCQGFRYWVRRARSKADTIDKDAARAPESPLHSLHSITSDMGLQAQPSRLRDDGHPTGSTSGTPTMRQRATVKNATSSMIPWDSVSSLEYGLSSTGDDAPMLPSPAPIFFMHGVGLGLTPYLYFIYQMMTNFRGRDMVLVECRHVSMSLCMKAKCPDVVCEVIAEIMQRNKWAKAAFVGHSYGTFVLSRMAQLHRDLVESMVLIDPVCMFTVWPSLLDNFIYTLPKIQHRGIAGLIDGVRYLFSRDLVIAESFCRKFVWHKVMLWPEEMPDVCLLVLSAADDLVPCELVQRHLRNVGSTCRTLLHETGGHGSFLMDHKFEKQVLANIQQVLNAGAALSAKEAS